MSDSEIEIVDNDQEPATAANHPCLVSLTERWERPFHKPLALNVKKNEFTVEEWAIEMYNMTPSGGMSGKGKAVLYFDYCPVCGKRLTAVRTEQEAVKAVSPPAAAVMTNEEYGRLLRLYRQVVAILPEYPEYQPCGSVFIQVIEEGVLFLDQCETEHWVYRDDVVADRP